LRVASDQTKTLDLNKPLAPPDSLLTVAASSGNRFSQFHHSLLHNVRFDVMSQADMNDNATIQHWTVFNTI